MQDPVPNGDALDQYKQPVIFPAFRDDLPIARNGSYGRLQIAEKGDLIGRKRNKPGKFVCERGREARLPRSRRLRRHLRSQLSVGRRLRRRLSRVKPPCPTIPTPPKGASGGYSGRDVVGAVGDARPDLRGKATSPLHSLIRIVS